LKEKITKNGQHKQITKWDLQTQCFADRQKLSLYGACHMNLTHTLIYT